MAVICRTEPLFTSSSNRSGAFEARANASRRPCAARAGLVSVASPSVTRWTVGVPAPGRAATRHRLVRAAFGVGVVAK